MSRTELTIGTILAVLLMGAAVVFLVFMRPPTPVPLGPMAAATSVWRGQTALAAYRAAEPVARSWAADAALLNASAVWPQGSRFEEGQATWSFTFYSAQAAAVRLISVVQGQATPLEAQPAVERLTAVDVHHWQLDSPAVIQNMMTAGGWAFLEQQGSATLALNLMAAGGRWQWEAVLFANHSGQAFSLRLDAAGGEMLTP